MEERSDSYVRLKISGKHITVVLGAAIALTFILFLAEVISAGFVGRKAVQIEKTNDRLVELRGKILHLDEILTMSVRMAAATGDPSWEKRYLTHEPMLDAAIKETLALAPASRVLEDAEKTDAATKELVKMEKDAFELIRNGLADKAEEILQSEKYEEQEKAYAQGMGQINGDVAVFKAREAGFEKEAELIHGSYVIIVFCLFVIMWIYVMKSVRGWKAALIDSNNRLHHEIYVQKEIEERLRDISGEWRTTFDAMDDAVALVDLNGVVVKHNRVMGKLVNAPGGGTILGGNICDLVYGRDITGEVCPFARMRNSGKRETMEFMLGARCMLIIVEPVLRPDGQPVSFVHIMRDITEFKRLEATRSNLMRGVSHTLKTPIANIRMACGIIEKGVASGDMEKVKIGYEVVRDNSDKSIMDVSKMLDMTHLERGIELGAATIASLKDAAEGIFSAYRYIADKKAIKLVSRIPKDSENVRVTKNDLQILIDNLIENAIKFTEKGEIKLEARNSGKFVTISVSDMGAGMSESETAKIFNKFYKLNPASDGLGIGLALCKEIAERWGGAIEAVSEGVGKGSTFNVALPAATQG